MKKITTRQFATIKRVAMNVNPLVTKKHKLLKQVEEINQEITNLCDEINGHEAGIMALTDGYVSEDLVKKVVEVNGNNKVTKYVPTNKVVYNEEENCYYIKDEELLQQVEEINTEISNY